MVVMANAITLTMATEIKIATVPTISITFFYCNDHK